MGFPSSLAIISTPVKRPKACKIKPNVPCAFNSVVYLTLIRTLQPLLLSLKDCNRKARINRLSNLSERYNENARKNKDKGIQTEKKWEGKGTGGETHPTPNPLVSPQLPGHCSQTRVGGVVVVLVCFHRGIGELIIISSSPSLFQASR